MHGLKKSLLAALFVLCLASLSQASVVYTFSGTYTDFNSGGVVGPVSFTLTLPSVVPNTGTTGFTPDATYFTGAQLTCDFCDYVSFYYNADLRGFTGTPSNVVGYGLPGSEYYFYFAPPSLTVNGTYTDVIGSWFGNQGTLTVTGAADPTTPEPGTLVLLGTGFVGLAGAVRRRLSL